MITAEDEKLLKAINAEPVKMFLTAALQAKSKGDLYNYNHIVHQLRIRDDPEMVACVYVGLASCVSLFSNRPDMYRELMQSILTYDWNSEKIVSIAFANLLSHIISSNVTFLLPILSMLVRTFTYSAPTADAVQPIDAADVAAAEAFKEEKLRRVHNTIQDVISLVPTGTSELFPVLASFFPHKRFSVAVQQEYTVQLLRICRYYPMIQERILDLIISKCLEIDVEIVIEDSGEVKIEEENHGDINDVIFSTDNDASSSNQVSQRVYNEGSQFIPSEVAEMADKLDTVLCLLIDFIRKEIEIQDIVDSDGLPLSTASINTNNNNNSNEKNKNNSNNSSNNNNNNNNDNDNKNQTQNEKAERLSTQLMRIFEEKILMTHRSKFVQFVLFYFASRVPSFGSKFGSRLVKLFSDESAAHTKRQSAILYLASYSVRANFLNISTISTILSDLIGWAEAYVIKTGTASASSKALLARNSSSMSLSLINYGNSTISVNSDSIVKSESTETTADDDDEEDVEVDEFGRKQTVIASAVSRHETFFSCVQAACYIVCFYGVEIANIQKACKISQRKWQIVLTSSLHPLRFCLQSVRVEFLRLAQQIQLLDERAWLDIPGDIIPQYGKIPLNKKNTLRNNNTNNNSGNVNMGAGFNPLDSFFPYDPCLLSQLHQPIEKFYRVWRGVPGLDDINEAENDLILDESCIIDADSVVDVSVGLTLGDFEMGEDGEGEGENGNNDEMKRSRSSSVSSQSDSDSDVSQSMTSSMQLCNSQIQSRSQSMDVPMAMSITESVGIGLLEEREKEKEKIRAIRGPDSRSQSMVSDCSLDEDSHPTHAHTHARLIPSLRTIPSFSQFSGIPDLPYDGQNNGFDGNTVKDEGGGQGDGGWPIPSRRPRQYSVSSQGSW